MNDFVTISKEYKSYEEFNKKLLEKINEINDYIEMLKDIPESKLMIPKKIGKIRCQLYKLYTDNKYKDLIYYTNGFNGYLDNICSIKNKMKNGMGRARFKGRFSNFGGMYYPGIVGDKKLNNIELNNNIIITGVNASRKTTLLKQYY